VEFQFLETIDSNPNFCQKLNRVRVRVRIRF
jgi:hypothetical protein